MKYLLLIHGYTQNGPIFKKKLKKIVSSFDNIIVPIAPININSDDEHDEKNKSPSLGWWTLPNSSLFTKPHKYNAEPAIAIVKEALDVVMKSDQLVVIAFSQGAVLAEIMYIHHHYPVVPIKMVLFSPAGIMDIKLTIDKPIDVSKSVLVIIGNKEKKQFGISKKFYSIVSYIDNYIFMSHTAGHVIPSKKIYVDRIIQFLSG